jgi:hypothetical protein
MARYPNTSANCKTTPEATVAATASAAWASRTDSVSLVMCVLHVELILDRLRRLPLRNKWSS